MLNPNLKFNILIIFLSILFCISYVYIIIQFNIYLWVLPLLAGVFIGKRFINPLIFKDERR